MVIPFLGLAQISSNYKQLSKENNANYFTIVDQARQEFRQMDSENTAVKKQIKQFERWAIYWESRVALEGKFPSELQGYFNAELLNERGQIVPQRDFNNQRSNQTWTYIGPVQADINNNGYPNFPQMGR